MKAKFKQKRHRKKADEKVRERKKEAKNKKKEENAKNFPILHLSLSFSQSLEQN